MVDTADCFDAMQYTLYAVKGMRPVIVKLDILKLSVLAVSLKIDI